MRVAIIGTRNITEDIYSKIEDHVPMNCSEIVSGGAKGVDTIAEIYAKKNNIKFTCFRPDYETFGSKAPIVRNEKIVNYSDYVLAFWNYKSKGTMNVIQSCLSHNKPVKIITVESL